MTQSKRVLIVDDERAILECLDVMMTDAGFHVEIIEESTLAVKRLGEQSFDLIITDINMPNLSGIQLIACAKVSDYNQKTPIFIMSGFVESHLKKLQDLNIVHIFKKGENFSKMIEKIKKIFAPNTPNPAIGYHPDVLDLFSNAAKELFSFYLNESDITINRPIINKAERKTPGIATGIIYLFGRQVFGSVALSCDAKLIQILAKTLFDLPENQVLPMQFLDLVGEFCNQLAGIIKSSFEKRRHHLQISLPYLLKGSDHLMPRILPCPVGSFELSFHTGNAWVDFCLGDPRSLKQSNFSENAADIMIYRDDMAA